MRFVECTHEAHAKVILDILNEAIIHSTALYDYEPRSLESMAAWFEARQSAGYPIIGAESEDGEFLGFACYGRFRARPAYKYTVEHSVYVQSRHRGEGVGTALMRRLIEIAGRQHYHVMVGGIDTASKASIALHEKLGFSRSGIIREAGFKFGRWLDVVFYQLILDTPEKPVDG